MSSRPGDALQTWNFCLQTRTKRPNRFSPFPLHFWSVLSWQQERVRLTNFLVGMDGVFQHHGYVTGKMTVEMKPMKWHPVVSKISFGEKSKIILYEVKHMRISFHVNIWIEKVWGAFLFLYEQIILFLKLQIFIWLINKPKVKGVFSINEFLTTMPNM